MGPPREYKPFSMEPSPASHPSASPTTQYADGQSLEFVGDENGAHAGNGHAALDPAYDSNTILEDHLRRFWEQQIRAAEEETPDFKHPSLPLARIKKVMKSDPEVKMIGSDAPILFAKACEIFIAEVTSRAWLVASAHKRRTLSRADIAKALAKSDQFDFLIDIVPREVANEKGRSSRSRDAGGAGSSGAQGLAADEEMDTVEEQDETEEMEETEHEAGGDVPSN